jgi:hypothetical protein
MKLGFFFIGVLSAALFGIATPLSKILLENLPQFQLAGLGMLPFVLFRRPRWPF